MARRSRSFCLRLESVSDAAPSPLCSRSSSSMRCSLLLLCSSFVCSSSASPDAAFVLSSARLWKAESTALSSANAGLELTSIRSSTINSGAAAEAADAAPFSDFTRVSPSALTSMCAVPLLPLLASCVSSPPSCFARLASPPPAAASFLHSSSFALCSCLICFWAARRRARLAASCSFFDAAAAAAVGAATGAGMAACGTDRRAARSGAKGGRLQYGGQRSAQLCCRANSVTALPVQKQAGSATEELSSRRAADVDGTQITESAQSI